MRQRFHRRLNQADPFIDLLFNALLGFTFLFLVAIMFVNPQARKGRVDLKAEFTMRDHVFPVLRGFRLVGSRQRGCESRRTVLLECDPYGLR